MQKTWSVPAVLLSVLFAIGVSHSAVADRGPRRQQPVVVSPDLGNSTEDDQARIKCPAFSLKSENGGRPAFLDVNNEQVLKWKAEGRNQFHDRGRVAGPIVEIYPDRNGHEHFSIQIGPRRSDTIEVVYNQAFGSVPDPKVGMQVEACGDYITSNAPSPAPGGKTYPASPDGAIVHWVHIAKGNSGHHSGYMIVDGVLTGQKLPNGH